MIRLRALTRSRFARKVRRYRRPLAAVFAALSVLLIVGALRPPPDIVITEPPRATLSPGEIGVPITLANTAMNTVIRSNDHVDVIALTTDGNTLLAHNVRVVEVLEGGLLVIAVEPAPATELAAASMQYPLTVTIHPRSVVNQ